MQIVLKKNTTPLNHCSRNLTKIATINGFLREGCDIMDPDIRVDYNAAYLTANYASIADFGRNYYYRKPPTIEGDIMLLHLHADTLMNYLPIVLASECIAERSSSRYNLYINDTALLGEVGYNYFQRKLNGDAFTPDNGKYILTVGGM